MGILTILKEKLTGGKKEDPEISTNLTPALERSLLYWHHKGKIDETFIRKLKNVNTFDADKIIEKAKHVKDNGGK